MFKFQIYIFISCDSYFQNLKYSLFALNKSDIIGERALKVFVKNVWSEIMAKKL